MLLVLCWISCFLLQCCLPYHCWVWFISMILFGIAKERKSILEETLCYCLALRPWWLQGKWYESGWVWNMTQNNLFLHLVALKVTYPRLCLVTIVSMIPLYPFSPAWIMIYVFVLLLPGTLFYHEISMFSCHLIIIFLTCLYFMVGSS